MSKAKSIMQRRLRSLASDLIISIPNVNSYNIHNTLSNLEKGIKSIRYDITIK